MYFDAAADGGPIPDPGQDPGASEAHDQTLKDHVTCTQADPVRISPPST